MNILPRSLVQQTTLTCPDLCSSRLSSELRDVCNCYRIKLASMIGLLQDTWHWVLYPIKYNQVLFLGELLKRERNQLSSTGFAFLLQWGNECIGSLIFPFQAPSINTLINTQVHYLVFLVNREGVLVTAFK